VEIPNLNDLPAEQRLLLAGLLAQLTGGAAPATPAKKAKKTRKAETVKYWTEEEWGRFIKLIQHPMYRAAFIVAYHRGLRANEIRKMQLSDWRAKDERLQVNRLKGSRSGEFHLGSVESRAIKAWLKVRGTEPGPLFRTRNGTGISQQMQDRLIKRYGPLAGISRDKCHVHCLKHTCATHLLARGESLEDVQDHLGHRSIGSTEAYAQFTTPRRQARDKRLRDW
jgi:type 1 fimbriae regulatory protein FimB